MKEKIRNAGVIKKLLISFLMLVFIFQFVPEKVSAAPILQAEVTGGEDYKKAWEILALVNIERSKVSLQPLKMDTELLSYGMQRAAECVIYFSHTRPDGTNALAGMPAFTAYALNGENLAYGQTSAAQVVQAWMNSQGHRDNILHSSFTSIGIGVYLSGGEYHYAQLFTSASATVPAETDVLISKPYTIDVDVALPAAKVEADATPSYNMNVGATQPLNLPGIYLNIADRVKLDIDYADLGYEIADPSIATIVGSDLQTANIQALGVGSTTLKVYVDGNPNKAVTFTITVSGTHVHTYVSTVVPPTCTTSGYTEHVCSCGDSYTDTPTAALGHNYTVTTVAPTCTTPGYTEHTCTTCTDKYQTPIPVVPHTYTATVVAPTCTVDGYTEYLCGDCGNTYQDTVVPAVGHDYMLTDISTVATPCMPGGYEEYTCNDCNNVYQESILPATHTYVSTIVAPTCTVDGYTEHVCSGCDDTYQDSIVAATAHTYVSTTVAPTCTVDGYTEHVCSDCGDTYQDNIIAAAHDYQSTIALAATCTVDGIMEHECSVCGDKLADTVIPAQGHAFGAWVVVSEDATTQTEERVCIHDGTVETRQVAKANTNDPQDQTNPNATQGGVGASGTAAKTGDVATMAFFVIGGIGAIAVIGLVIVRSKRVK